MAADGDEDTAYKLPPAVTSLSARLLMLTVAFVMLAEIAIFVPSIARFRLVFLKEHLAKADLASLALEATPDGMVSEALARRLLEQADSRAIVIRGAKWRRLIQGSAMPGQVGAAFDLRRKLSRTIPFRCWSSPYTTTSTRDRWELARFWQERWRRGIPLPN